MNSPPFVPYQAYKSKKHGRNTSNQSGSNGASPNLRPLTTVLNAGDRHAHSEPLIHQRTGSLSRTESLMRPGSSFNDRTRPASMLAAVPSHDRPDTLHHIYATYPSTPAPASGETSPTDSYVNHATTSSPVSMISPTLSKAPAHAVNGNRVASAVAGPSHAPSTAPSDRASTSRKTSTFRHVPLRAANTRQALPSSPLRPADSHSRTPSNASTVSRQLDLPRIVQTPSQGSSSAPSPSVAPNDRALPALPTLDLTSQQAPSRSDVHDSPSTNSPTSPSSTVSQPRAASSGSSPGLQSRTLSPIPVSYSVHAPSVASSPSPSANARSAVRTSAPYRPGFQPKGVCWPRTDEFVEARKACLDVGRIERTRLERRLEKLVNLHFPPEEQKLKEKAAQTDKRPQRLNKGLSSIFDMDFSELRSKSASDLWRDVIQSPATPGGKQDIRAAEQTITPWEDDASVSQCPLCSASFHPITNRKHHCRLCGRIICSLPVKHPQRPQTCSLLFVADPQTGRIEEVGEGVDYGVRRRTASYSQTRGKEDVLSEEEKFLKGVRICRGCRPVLLRQQHKYEVHSVPVFFKLYEAFISLEKEIEDALPQFQELMLSLSKHERPTPEASAARKRLLEAFAQYDMLAKRIRQLPCPSGPGGSQDRIQTAILNRANLFLQKHMFPLQSLPKATNKSEVLTDNPTETEDQAIDPDSEVARVLQPLLEQEALLESFVEEAKAHRKFEDAKTLKTNLKEIRAEINRILANAEAGMGARPGQEIHESEKM